MYQKFYIRKTDHTYANLLEAYGLANLIQKIDENAIIKFDDSDFQITLSLSQPISKETIEQLSYFQIVKFIKNKPQTPEPEGIGKNFFDYPKQRDFRKARREETDKAFKNKEMKKVEGALDKRLKEIIQKYEQSEGIPWEQEYDIYGQMISNPYSSFNKLYNNLALNKEHFPILVGEIFEKYVNPTYEYTLKKNRSIKLTHDISQLQLFNPSKGNGLNKPKASGLGSSNISTNWISEILKISGALNSMLCQSVKVGSTYDLKIFVPVFNNVSQSKKSRIVSKFKKGTKSYSPVRLDIINILKLLKTFIENDKDYKNGKLKDTVRGLHSVYQKDLGNNKAVTNIAFINTPEFIVIDNRNSGKNWMKLLSEHQKIINGIEERGDAIQGLIAYRNFLSGSDVNSFFKFIYWYGAHLMHELSKDNYYTTPFRIDSLNMLFECLEKSLNSKYDNMKFQEIIQDEGFQSVAAAIRKSTVSLMYTPKDQRKYEVRYGFARRLQNKSKTNEELVTFISDFIAGFNTERARKSELGKAYQKPIREDVLMKFYQLIDNVDDSKMLGAMLAAYGFALAPKEETPVTK